MTDAAATWADLSPHRQDIVNVNGIHLHYLEWGKSRRTLILIHGLGDNPHLFDDMAPGFMDHFRVIAYARRGHGSSDARPPYDSATLTADLVGLMDTLGIERADFAGYSMGGNEITAMAANYPERVDRIVYLDAAYDYADADYATASDAVPAILRTTPAGATDSLETYRAFYQAEYFGGLQEMGRVEAYIRESVIMQSDGQVKQKIAQRVEELQFAIMNDPPRAYTKVRCPVLAIYAETTLSHQGVDLNRRRLGSNWEQEYMAPFRQQSMKRIERELANVKIITVRGGHNDFLFTSSDQVIQAMKEFLGAPHGDVAPEAVQVAKGSAV